MAERLSGQVRIRVDGVELSVREGTTLAAATYALRERRSLSGEPRAPLCGMGSCYECRATVDGRPMQRTCLLVCRDGMEVERDA